MKTFASTAVVAVALACSACGGGASAGKQPEAQPAPQTQTAAANPTTDLPEQFKDSWTVGACPNQQNTGTGLDTGDIITIKDPVGLSIRLGIQGSRKPDPMQLENAALTVVHPQNVTTQNVLTPEDVALLCTAGTRGFKAAFGTVLAKHDFRLTYLIGISELHAGHSTLVIFLPYVDKMEAGARFFLAALDLGDDPDKAEPETHNGIVHGMP